MPYVEQIDYLSSQSIDAIKIYNKEIKNVKKLTDKLITLLNKNKFDYGLKGQTKQKLEEQGKLPSISEQYTLEQGYMKTPATEMGGKNTRKKRITKYKRITKNKRTIKK
jgi:hypothetical protein